MAVVSVLLVSEPLPGYGNLNWLFACLFERTPCRYSDAPINESNWDFASQVSGEPTPAEPGTEERWIIPAILGVNQHWYFALKTADNAGRWSEISNVSSLLANGFRPNPNGYQDSNFAGIVGDDFTIDDMREMFGDRTVCTKTWPTCLPRVGALAWRGLALLSMERGRCAGMAATSLRFFDGLETPSQFQDGAHFPYDIENIEGNMDIRKYIAYYHAEQVGLPILGYRTREESTSTPAETLHELQDALTNGESMVLIIKKNNGPGGHAVTPYAIQERGDGKWFIIIYDNENPNKQIPIFVNEISNTWNYGEEGFVSDWFGDEHTHSLYLIPLSLFNGPQFCPSCLISPINKTADEATNILFLDGDGHLLLTDNEGRQTGYDNGTFINDIPWVHTTPFLTGLNNEQEPLYVTSITGTISISLTGQHLTTTNSITLTQLGASHVVSLKDVTIDSSTQDSILISSDGKEITYEPNVEKTVTLSLASDTETTRSIYEIRNADIGATQVISMSNLTSIGQLAIEKSGNRISNYTLFLNELSQYDEKTFLHHDIAIKATDTHFVDYHNWQGFGPITIYIDAGSDGSIDEELLLENQNVSILYLPIITLD